MNRSGKSKKRLVGKRTRWKLGHIDQCLQQRAHEPIIKASGFNRKCDLETHGKESKIVRITLDCSLI